MQRWRCDGSGQTEGGCLWVIRDQRWRTNVVALPTRVWPKPIVHIYESESRGREGTVYRVLAWHGVYECDCPARVECHHIKKQRAADIADLTFLQEIRSEERRVGKE